MGSECCTLRSSTERLRLEGSAIVLGREAKELLKESAELSAALAAVTPAAADLSDARFLHFLRDLRVKKGRRHSQKASMIPGESIDSALKEAVEFQLHEGLSAPAQDWQSLVHTLASRYSALLALNRRYRALAEKYTTHLQEVSALLKDMQRHNYKRIPAFATADPRSVDQFNATGSSLKQTVWVASQCVLTLNSFESEPPTDSNDSAGL